MGRGGGRVVVIAAQSAPACLRQEPGAVNTTSLSRVHSPTLYFDARLRFACSPAPLRPRARPSSALT
ncbi:hypothetical protein [Oryza sativa Japonica Group]|uniref:Uncharacterized protein n=1 Tax=Oryza sativa subsp. japonica TaxID=39947 RepID=Q94JE4_ORYSJ|nr:hypothetical protein [Oryza sativa Japonica Group]BAB86515.1 hypothetical protein [Oryza sativa Japonica Group]